MGKVGEFESVKELVKAVLEQDERARKDDKWLVYQVYRRLTKIFIPFEDFKKLPSPETITRWRRYFQNELGKYKDSKTQRKRYQAEEEVREFFSDE